MKYFLSALVILYSSALFSQNKKEYTPDILRDEIVTIKANENKATNLKFPFSSVKVMDYRFDTSKIGFVKKGDFWGNGTSLYKKIALKNNLQHAVQNFYNSYYQDCFTKDSSHLVVLVKRFWADPAPNLQVQQQQRNVMRSSIFNLYLQFEFLLERNGQYLPFKRIDTLFQQIQNVFNGELNGFKENGYKFYEYALATVFESVNYQFYADKFTTSKNLKTLQEVTDFSARRFQFPILRDAVLNKGVYLSFQEFRNNNPSIIQYKVEKKKKVGRLLYDMTKVDSPQIIKYWGYCDGSNIYCGTLQNPLKRIGNTFDFFCTRTEYYTHYSNPGNYIPTTYTSEYKILEPFQIDMETGKIY